MRVKDLCDFIEKRELHRQAKEGLRVFRGNRKPDPIISEYRFCNVRRNDDRVTKWIHREYMDHFGSSPYLWFALVVARLFNKEDTLAAIRHTVLPFNYVAMRRQLKALRNEEKVVFNAAYIVSTNGRKMDKVDYVIDLVLKPLWKDRDKLTKLLDTGLLANAHMTLVERQGLGSFMAAQVLADWKYANDGRTWDDFHTFAASGPGSKRGLNRVCDLPLESSWPEAIFRDHLRDLRDRVNARLDMEPLTAQDLQNCLCEFDKYERARLGEGRPKQKYVPLKEKG